MYRKYLKNKMRTLDLTDLNINPKKKTRIFHIKRANSLNQEKKDTYYTNASDQRPVFRCSRWATAAKPTRANAANIKSFGVWDHSVKLAH
jgi:hypothetical protein